MTTITYEVRGQIGDAMPYLCSIFKTKEEAVEYVKQSLMDVLKFPSSPNFPASKFFIMPVDSEARWARIDALVESINKRLDDIELGMKKAVAGN